MTINLDYAARAAARRQITFALGARDSEGDRHADAVEARKLLERAACLAVTAGRPEVANDALSLLAKLEARP